MKALAQIAYERWRGEQYAKNPDWDQLDSRVQIIWALVASAVETEFRKRLLHVEPQKNTDPIIPPKPGPKSTIPTGRKRGRPAKVRS